MSRTLTAADRSALIRLASVLPVGSTERRAILAGFIQGAKRGDRFVVVRPVRLAVDYKASPYAYGMPIPVYEEVPVGAELVFVRTEKGWGSDPGLEPVMWYPAKKVEGTMAEAGMWGQLPDTHLKPIPMPERTVRVGDEVSVDRESIFYVKDWGRLYPGSPPGAGTVGEVVAVDPRHGGGAGGGSVTFRTTKSRHPGMVGIEYTVPASALVIL